MINNQTLDFLKKLKVNYDLKEDSNNVLNKEDKKDIFDECISATLALSESTQIQEESFLESIFLEKLNYIKDNYSHMKKMIEMKVSLIGHEEHIFRIVELPYDITLADMAYFILSSFHAYNRNQFMIETHQKKYVSDTCEIHQAHEYASLVSLPELSLEEGESMKLIYDFEERYIFDISIEEICDCDRIQHLENACVIAGKGYGIWEGAHDLLDAYYHDQTQFKNMISGFNLDELDFYIDDYEDSVSILKQSEELRMAYEIVKGV